MEEYLQLKKIINSYQAVISYKPFVDEPNPEEIFPLIRPCVKYIVPLTYSALPTETSNTVKKIVGKGRVCIYIPGKSFDRNGVRYGRGRGWYDHFLSEIPSGWLRIGFCFRKQFSESSLKKEPWDELIDWVCAKDNEKIRCYETSARSKNEN